MNSNAPRKSLAGIFVLCWLGLLADGYDLYVYGATLPALIGQPPFNVTPAGAGAVGSLALVGMLLGSLIVGTLTDRLGRRRIFVGALALFSLAMLACAMAPSWELFAVFRFIACFGVGGLLPTAVALTNEFAPPGKKSLVLGAVLTGPATGTVAASLTSLAVLESSGRGPNFWLATDARTVPTTAPTEYASRNDTEDPTPNPAVRMICGSHVLTPKMVSRLRMVMAHSRTVVPAVPWANRARVGETRTAAAGTSRVRGRP